MFIRILAFALLVTLFAGAYYLPKDDAQRSINLPRKHRKISRDSITTMNVAPLPTDLTSEEILEPAPGEPAATQPDNPVELGRVRWLRDLDEALTRARAAGKPALILFQEVPGCDNCTRYGSSTLSHPLIVEAIETYFVPVCIYNNKSGADAAALKRFNEPAWNNPVVRIVRADSGADMVPRMPDFNSTAGLVAGLRAAIEAGGSAVPAWLDLLYEELHARETGTQTATFSMSCFWVGEGTFGNEPGVIATEAGFQDGREVVRVTYDPARTGKAELTTRTQPQGMQACAKNDGFRADNEPKYYLSRTHYRFVPMTPLQAARANSLVGKRQSPDAVLSPRQLALAEFIRANPDKNWKPAIGAEDLAAAWTAAQKVREH